MLVWRTPKPGTLPVRVISPPAGTTFFATACVSAIAPVPLRISTRGRFPRMNSASGKSARRIVDLDRAGEVDVEVTRGCEQAREPRVVHDDELIEVDPEGVAERCRDQRRRTELRQLEERLSVERRNLNQGRRGHEHHRPD